MFREQDLVCTYTRARAIEDGVLVDCTAVAAEAGIRVPVAITRATWEKYVKVPRGVECQDEEGRLWDIVWMLAAAMREASGRAELRFRLYVRNDNRRPRPVTLKAVCGPDDAGRPCITVMMPDED